MEYKDYYKVLGVSRNADEQEIKRAFRKLAQQYHPDKNPGNAEAEKRFKEANEAHTVLSDPDKRSKYDRFGSQWEQYTRTGGRPEDFNWGGVGRGASGQTRTMSPEEFEKYFGGGDFSSFFEALFGGNVGGMGGARPGGGQFRTRTSPGGSFDPFMGAQRQPQEVTVTVSLEEAFQGAARTLESSDGTRIQANIPRGVRTGSKVRMKDASGQGEIFLKVEVKSHPQFERDGDDLRVKLPIDLYTLLLGGEAHVPTMERPVVLKIPPGTQSGKMFRLRNLGMPNLKQPDQRGDLLAEVTVTLPTDLTNEERQLIQRLRDLRSAKS